MHDDSELKSLIEAYRRGTAELRQAQQEREAATIKLLDVVRDPSGGDFLVSVDLNGASVPLVVQELLETTQEPYNLSAVRLGGRATARFTGLPLLSALNELLNPHGISVGRASGILQFKYGRAVDLSAGADSSDGQTTNSGGSGGTAYREVSLSYLDASQAVDFLDRIYGDDDDDDDDDGDDDDDSDSSTGSSEFDIDLGGGGELKYGALPELNAIFLAGPADDVSSAAILLGQVDREVPHVLIEALVVELDVAAVMQLGTNITDAALGVASGVQLLPAAVGGNIGFTLLEGAANPAQLTAVIDLLVSQDKAQVLSRPYLSARSSQQASIQIVNQRYVAVDESVEGAAITTTDAVTAGVVLTVTPIVQAEEMIRLDMEVEESQFVAVVGDEILSKDSNTAQTAMTVQSGETIVVGGLNLRRRQALNAGLPWLRRVPGLNLLFAEQAAAEDAKEVVVYLTPYIWTPQMDLPLPLPTTPGVDSLGSTGFEDPEPLSHDTNE